MEEKAYLFFEVPVRSASRKKTTANHGILNPLIERITVAALEAGPGLYSLREFCQTGRT